MTAFTDEDFELLLRTEQLIWEDRCRESLIDWAVEALAPFHQTPAAHHAVLLDHLQRVERGEIKRLMVYMPPGSAKSTYCSVLFPAWCFNRRSNMDIIGASHSADLAEDFSGRIQGLVQNNTRLLRYTLLSENVKRWRTSNGCFYRAGSVGGSITGRRADGGIIDDPVRGVQDAESETIRESTWAWYQADFYTRLKPGAWIVFIMTRWNKDDLGGKLLQAMEAGADQWTILKLPAIADSLDDPLGRPIGAALWPAWQDELELERIRTNVGEYVFGALYQQNPQPRGAAFFDIDLLLVQSEQLIGTTGMKLRAPAPMPDRCDTVYATVDTAIKTGQEHNSTAVTYWSYNQYLHPSTYILDWDIIQILGAEQESWLPSVFTHGEELARRCGARRGFAGAMIEDKATGTVLLQQAENLRHRGEYAPAYPIDSVLTSMGKEERAIAAAPYFISEDIKITDEAFNKTKVHKGRSANHLIDQVSGFRLGTKETDKRDLLDTFCYGILITHATASGDRKGI